MSPLCLQEARRGAVDGRQFGALDRRRRDGILAPAIKADMPFLTRRERDLYVHR